MKLFIRLSGKEINKCLFKSSISSSLFSQRRSYLVSGQVSWSDLWISTGKGNSQGSRSCVREEAGAGISPSFVPPGLLWGIGPGSKDMSRQPHWGGAGGGGPLGSCSVGNAQDLQYLQVGPLIFTTKWSPSCLSYHWNIFNFCPFSWTPFQWS